MYHIFTDRLLRLNSGAGRLFLLSGKKEEDKSGQDEKRNAEYRSITDPGNRGYDERPGKTHDPDEPDSPTEDIRDERKNLRQGHDEVEDALQSADNQEKSQDAEDPEQDLVGLVLPSHLIRGPVPITSAENSFPFFALKWVSISRT